MRGHRSFLLNVVIVFIFIIIIKEKKAILKKLLDSFNIFVKRNERKRAFDKSKYCRALKKLLEK